MTDDYEYETARMMAASGLRPRDIAEALNVHEYQVRQWLRPSSKPIDDDEPPEAA